jgi:hypothetical protein
MYFSIQSQTSCKNSDLTQNTLSQDKIISNFQTLVKKENKRNIFNKNFCDEQLRVKAICKILMKVCKYKKYGHNTFATAISILDTCISNFFITSQNIFQIAALSVSFASKIHESRSINLKEINSLLPLLNFSEINIVDLEFRVLQKLDFKINHVTSFDFLELLVHNEEFSFYPSKNPTINPISSESFFDLIIKIHRLTTLNYSLTKYKPHLKALAIYILAKNFCGIKEKNALNATFLIDLQIDDLQNVYKEVNRIVNLHTML